jgi:hypothetical protein
MSSASELLNFTISASTLGKKAERILELPSFKQVDAQISRLNSLVEKLGSVEEKKISLDLVRLVVKKFKTALESDFDLTKFDKKELRTLSFGLFYQYENTRPIIAEKKELIRALILLLKNWRDSYIIALFDCYLRIWGLESFSVQQDAISKLVLEKLMTYEGNRKDLLNLKSNIRFFQILNGPESLGYELAAKGLPTLSSTKFLNVPESWFSYPYFTYVLLSYFDKNKSHLPQIIDELDRSVRMHNRSKAKREIVCKIIQIASKPEFSLCRPKAQIMGFELIGDPAKAANWLNSEGDSDSMKAELPKARSILNDWITEQFITVFFEKCINNPRRKAFWSRYINEIKYFKVVGSKLVYYLLKRDSRIEKFVDGRFTLTGSTRDQNAALMFIIRNHLFVEFSDDGAFYVYEVGGDDTPQFDRNYYSSTSDLKRTYLQQIIYRQGSHFYNLSAKGRLPHSDGDVTWEKAAEYWIKNQLGVYG